MAAPFIWDGASWTPLTKSKTRYWNGAAWAEPSDIKYWNGAAWETIFGTSGGGGGTISLRASASNSANSANSLGVTIPASTQDGDLLVLLVGQVANSATLFGAISGWTKQGEQRAGSAAFTIGVYTRIAQPGDAGATVTSTSAGTAHYVGQVRAYSGVHQTTPMDNTPVFSQLDLNATTHDASAITVATTSAMLLTLYGVPTSSGTTLAAADWTGPTSFTDELVTCSNGTGNNACIAFYNMETPGTGSQGPFTATITQARRWATCTLALRPA